MNKEETKKLLELYEQGLSSSEEETLLYKNLGDANPWFNYLKNKRIKSPINIEAQIWNKIQSQE